MSRRSRGGDWAIWCAVTGMLGISVCGPLWASQHPVKSRTHNYPNAPVTLSGSRVTLVEIYATPSQGGIPGSGRSRIQYANRKDLVPPTMTLTGEVVCSNVSPQAIEAVKLTLVLLDAFHGAIGPSGQQDRFVVKQVIVPIPAKASKVITWEQQVETTEIYEVAVVVTGVRFADRSVWLAPSEELIDIF